MGRPSPLYVKWKQQKARARRSGYWGRGLMKGQQSGPFLKDMDAFAGSKHASSKRHESLSRLFDMATEANWSRMAKRIGPELANYGRQALYKVFFEPKEAGVGDHDIDPKLVILDRQTVLYQLNNDPKYRYLRFNFVYLDGSEDEPFYLSLHFQGKEYFLVEKRIDYLRRSSVYTDRQHMLDLYELGRVQWASKVPINPE